MLEMDVSRHGFFRSGLRKCSKLTARTLQRHAGFCFSGNFFLKLLVQEANKIKLKSTVRSLLFSILAIKLRCAEVLLNNASL